jgi:DNA-binding NarL/FixJ family response regulator
MTRHVPPPLIPLGLSPRLIDVLALLMIGQSNRSIADELGLSAETVKEYVATVLSKLQVSSRAQIPEVIRPYHQELTAWRVEQAVRRVKASAGRPRLE